MAPKKIGSILSRWSLTELRERGLLRDVTLGVFFVLSLACFLHSKDVRIDHLQLNSIADKYIIAKTEFKFPDIEATRILKEESVRDLGKIYDLQEREIFRVEKKIQEALVDRPYWRQELPSTTYEELILASEALRNTLLKIKFTDQRTIAKLKELGECSAHCIIFTPEKTNDVLPEGVWREIEKIVFAVQTPATQFILQKYQGHPWLLQEDLERQHFLSRLIKDSIKLKMTKVPNGERIINAGDKVTMRHIDMLRGMKKRLAEECNKITLWSILGSLGLSLTLTLVGWFYIKTIYPSVLKSASKKALIASVILFTLILSKLIEYILINNAGHLADLCRFPVFVPLATLLLTILIDRTVAMIVSQFVALMLTTTLILHHYDHFLVINLVTAVMGTVLVKTVRRRKEVFEICVKIWFVTVPLIIGINLMENTTWNYQIAIDLLTSLISMALIGIVVVTVLPLLESTFKISTDMTLLESGDLSHPLLRRLNLEAPGTYRHSLAVAALAEEAAIAINANPIFCRVAALYHDIGKLSQPQYFTENQFTGFNMHQLLSPEESAQVIIAHVTEGVKLAQQYKLPPTLINVIQEHHGTGLVYYFYHAQVEQCRLKAIPAEERLFRYPGPTPQSRESAIIMIADSIEAAYRCLDEFSERAIVELVESISRDKIREHQLDTSCLTFEEIEGIKKAMILALITSAHTRVKYPEKPSSVPWKPQEAFVRLS